MVAFDFIYGWGGLWSAEGQSIDGDLARLAGVTVEDVIDARSRIDTLLRAEGMGEFIKSFDEKYGSWECFALLPYFSKGIGIRRFQAEERQVLQGFPWDRWRHASEQVEAQCKKYEQSH